MKFTDYCNRIIEYSFYALFLLVPLVFSGSTSELFELNKMWLTYGVTVIIGMAWMSKMIAEKEIKIQRTPLDIPILLFLASQTISTIISMDPHVSFWGYYSRFNGGLLSTICYILLFYAFVTNFPGLLHKLKENVRNKHIPIVNTSAGVVRKVLLASLLAGTGVALWGIPSHFGADPTCMVFRGTLDTSCWTEAFKPTIRAFSTLGQPAWLAAYVSVLLPISIAFFLMKFHAKKHSSSTGYVTAFVLTVLFFLCLIFASTRAGYLAFGIADILFWAVIAYKHLVPTKMLVRYLIIFHVVFLASSFIFGVPFSALQKFTLPEINNTLSAKPTPATTSLETPEAAANLNITDSADIRLIVWQGAIDAWKSNPLIGTGVETFAYAYYQYKPVAHNTTSEWDYLYNKAHNEYLNYLATTGLFGLGSYLAIIAGFLWVTFKRIVPFGDSKQNTLTEEEKVTEVSKTNLLLIVGMVFGFVSILISNFFGFSVVIINLYFFLIPAFVFVLGNLLRPEHVLSYKFSDEKTYDVDAYQWTGIIFVVGVGIGLLILLMVTWNVDTKYALGSNLNRVGNYQQAYMLLDEAAKTIPLEPVYQDELSNNEATIAMALYLNKAATNAAFFEQEAITHNNEVLANHPNNVVYWKNRVRLFYALAQGNPGKEKAYFAEALKAMLRASELAPNDAKIAYNLAVLYDENGQKEKAIEAAKRTIQLKPDYRDAHVALGLFYHEKGMKKEAIGVYENILKQLNPGDKEVKETLDKWKKE